MPKHVAIKVLTFTALLTWSATILALSCHPKIDPKIPQYIIGYGSLIDEQSKRETDPSAEANFPVLIKGYRRSWSVHIRLPKLNATFLTIIEDPNASFNGVIYKLNHSENIHQYDLREKNYCRRAFDSDQLKMYVGNLPEKKQIWIYIAPKNKLELPRHDAPIVQSYVDIFIRGCIQAEEKFNINHFAKDCIKTTNEWSVHWENNRIFPCRPSFHEPYAEKIDALLKENLPEKFKKIKLNTNCTKYFSCGFR